MPVEILKPNFEEVSQKAQNILYRAHRLSLRKRSEGAGIPPASSMAYPVYLIITPCTSYLVTSIVSVVVIKDKQVMI